MSVGAVYDEMRGHRPRLQQIRHYLDRLLEKAAPLQFSVASSERSPISSANVGAISIVRRDALPHESRWPLR